MNNFFIYLDFISFIYSYSYLLDNHNFSFFRDIIFFFIYDLDNHNFSYKKASSSSSSSLDNL